MGSLSSWDGVNATEVVEPTAGGDVDARTVSTESADGVAWIFTPQCRQKLAPTLISPPQLAQLSVVP
jgi:hypothetical protein